MDDHEAAVKVHSAYYLFNRIPLCHNFRGSRSALPPIALLVLIGASLSLWVCSVGANTLPQDNAWFVYGQYDESYLVTGPKLCSKRVCPTSQWLLEATELPENLCDHASAMNSTRVWTTGGFDGTSAVADVRYATLSDGSDPLSTWAVGPSLPSPVRDHAMTIANSFAYVLGGRASGAPRDSVLIGEFKYDGSLTRWRPSSAPLPMPLWNLRAVSVGNYIYVMGGCNATAEGSATDVVYYANIRPDGELDAWQTGSALPAPRSGHAVVATDSRIWVLGGYDTSGTDQATVYYADVDPLSGALSAWQTAGSMPVALRDHAGILQNGIVTVLGGRSGTSVVKAVYTCNINADLSLAGWTAAGNLRQEMERHEGLRVNGRIYRLGGRSRTGQYVRDAEYTTLTQDPGQWWAFRSRFVSRSIDFRFTPIVNQISWDTTGSGSVGLRWRIAGDDGVWSSWSSLDTSSPASVGQSGRHLQYQVEFRSNGSHVQASQVTAIRVDVIGETFVQGNLSGAQHWTHSESPYVVYSTVSLLSGCNLTIDPGVRVYFDWDAGLSVGAGSTISAIGTESDSIHFSSLDDEIGHWKGVYWASTLSGALSYCVFEKAGETWNGFRSNLICANTPQPILDHCVFRWSSKDGLHLSNSSTIVEACRAYGNADAGMRVTGRWSSGAAILTDCESSGNMDGVVFEGSAEATPTKLQFSDIHHNLQDGFRATTSSTPCLSSNTVHENVRYPVYLDANSWLAFDCWTGNFILGRWNGGSRVRGAHDRSGQGHVRSRFLLPGPW